MSKGMSPVVLTGAILGMMSAVLSLGIFPNIANSLAGAQEAGSAQGQAEKLAEDINQVCSSPMTSKPVEINIGEEYTLEVDQTAGNKEVELRKDVIQDTYELSECEDIDVKENEFGSGSYNIVQDRENNEVTVE